MMTIKTMFHFLSTDKIMIEEKHGDGYVYPNCGYKELFSRLIKPESEVNYLFLRSFFLTPVVVSIVLIIFIALSKESLFAVNLYGAELLVVSALFFYGIVHLYLYMRSVLGSEKEKIEC